MHAQNRTNKINLSEYLQSLGTEIRFQNGEVLWKQGDHASYVFAVSSGILKLQRCWPSGSQTILGLSNRGSIIGEETVISNSKRNATCIAISPGRGFRIPKQSIDKVVNSAEVSLSLLELSSQRFQETLLRMEELLDGSVENRLASTIIRLGEQLGFSDGRGIFIPVRLTRGELAEFIGCRAETTTRLMTKWKRGNIVESKREGITINDLDALRKIAGVA